MDEEQIFAALADRMSTVTWTKSSVAHSFATVSRRVKIFTDVPADMQPACYQAEWASEDEQRTNLPYRTVLEANWIIYQCVSRDSDAVGATENNLILGGVRKALDPLPSDPGFMDKRNTLGGLVYHCFIRGKIFKDPGDIDGQGMMVVPIRILVP